MKKIAVYARCAHASPEAIERQLQRCEEVAQREGLNLDAALTFRDDGYSGHGSPDQRPEYRRLTEAIRAGKVQTLAVTDLSRLSRTGSELKAILWLLNLYGVQLLVADAQSNLVTLHQMVIQAHSKAETELRSVRARRAWQQRKVLLEEGGESTFDASGQPPKR